MDSAERHTTQESEIMPDSMQKSAVLKQRLVGVIVLGLVFFLFFTFVLDDPREEITFSRSNVPDFPEPMPMMTMRLDEEKMFQQLQEAPKPEPVTQQSTIQEKTAAQATPEKAVVASAPAAKPATKIEREVETPSAQKPAQPALETRPKPVAKPAPKPAPKVVSKPEFKSAPKPAIQSTPKREYSSALKPAFEFSRKPAQKPQTKPKPVISGGRWVVQLASFEIKKRKRANWFLNRVRKKGYAVETKQIRKNGILYIQIMTKPVTSRAAADRLKARIDRDFRVDHVTGWVRKVD